MTYTVFCILFTTSLGIMFKISERFKARSSVIIPINYLICFLIGLFFSGFSLTDQYSKEWIPYCLLLGVLFFIGFSYFSKAIDIAGIAVATLFQKMSIIITLLVTLILGYSLNTYQLMGIIFGLGSMALILKVDIFRLQNMIKGSRTLFISLSCSAAIEITFIIITERLMLNSESKIIFQSFIFLIAGIIGVIFNKLIIICRSFTLSEITIGVLLGIFNYFSILYLLMALSHEIKGPVFFSVLNTSVIALTFLAGYFIFREKLNLNQIMGIILSVISIILIYQSNF